MSRKSFIFVLFYSLFVANMAGAMEAEDDNALLCCDDEFVGLGDSIMSEMTDCRCTYGKALKKVLPLKFPSSANPTPKKLAELIDNVCSHCEKTDQLACGQLLLKRDGLGEYSAEDIALALTSIHLDFLNGCSEDDFKDYCQNKEGSIPQKTMIHFDRSMRYFMLLMLNDPPKYIPLFMNVLSNLDRLRNAHGVTILYLSLINIDQLVYVTVPKAKKFLEKFKVFEDLKLNYYEKKPNITLLSKHYENYSKASDVKKVVEKGCRDPKINVISTYHIAQEDAASYPEFPETVVFNKLLNMLRNIRGISDDEISAMRSFRKNIAAMQGIMGHEITDPSTSTPLPMWTQEQLIAFMIVHKQESLLKMLARAGFKTGKEVAQMVSLVSNKPKALTIMLGVHSGITRVLLDKMNIQPMLESSDSSPSSSSPSNSSPTKIVPSLKKQESKRGSGGKRRVTTDASSSGGGDNERKSPRRKDRQTLEEPNDVPKLPLDTVKVTDGGDSESKRKTPPRRKDRQTLDEQSVPKSALESLRGKISKDTATRDTATRDTATKDTAPSIVRFKQTNFGSLDGSLKTKFLDIKHLDGCPAPVFELIELKHNLNNPDIAVTINFTPKARPQVDTIQLGQNPSNPVNVDFSGSPRFQQEIESVQN